MGGERRSPGGSGVGVTTFEAEHTVVFCCLCYRIINLTVAGCRGNQPHAVDITVAVGAVMNHNAVSVRLIGRVLGRCDEFFHVWAQLWGDHCDTGTTTMQHPGPACSDRAAAHNKDGAPGESHTKRKNVRHDDLARSNLDRVLRRTGGGINFASSASPTIPAARVYPLAGSITRKEPMWRESK